MSVSDGIGRVSDAPAPDSPRGVRTYEEFEGGEGRVLSFRPHRFAASDFAPLRSTVTLGRGGGRRECALRDVSRNGVAFTLPPDAVAEVGQPVQLVVRLDRHEIWSGNAGVRSVREQDGATVVGASFGDVLLDTDDLLRLRDVWIPKIAAIRLEEQPWYSRGAHAFKALVSELRLYLETLEEKLRALEASLPWNVREAQSSLSRTALVASLRAEVSADVLRLLNEIGAASRAAEPTEATALKEFSVRQIQSLLMQAPWLNRARNKPLGYAGDFEIMNFLYERDFEGRSLFARTVGYAFMQSAAARAVRCRKDLMKRVLRSILEKRAGSTRPVRFLSIASGPARELQELFGEMEELPAELEIVLFDQDKTALEHAYQRLRPVADARFPRRVRIVFLNESIKRLLRDIRLFEEMERFDAVYSVGLFDYLHEVTAVRLARNLCAAAAPGGIVLIGNMVDHPHRWVMDYHLEWELLYRTREQLAEIGRRAAPAAHIRVLDEESGVNPFIEMVPTP